MRRAVRLLFLLNLLLHGYGTLDSDVSLTDPFLQATVVISIGV
jgi:hypothetical protein